MATVLFTWELGRGLGHLVPMLPLARALSQRGHKVFVAARDVAAAPAVFGDAGVSLLAAPFALNPPVYFPRTVNYAQLLANVGWGDYDRLFGLASAWRNVLGSIAEPGSVLNSGPDPGPDCEATATYLKPMLKSCPHRLTAVLSRATQPSSSTSSPSQPNSTSKPPGVFM